MEETSLTLVELSEASGIESRTIRSYIERGLLSGAESRGRGAVYTNEHLTRLRVIQALRRARPNIQLSEIRLLFQQLSPQQIRNLASGSLTANTGSLSPLPDNADTPSDPSETSCRSSPQSEQTETPHDEDQANQFVSTPQPLPEQLTAVHRLLLALRQLAEPTPTVVSSKLETWHRISINADIELLIRAEFGPDQVAAFREVADLLRHLLTRSELPVHQGGE